MHSIPRQTSKVLSPAIFMPDRIAASSLTCNCDVIRIIRY